MPLRVRVMLYRSLFLLLYDMVALIGARSLFSPYDVFNALQEGCELAYPPHRPLAWDKAPVSSGGLWGGYTKGQFLVPGQGGSIYLYKGLMRHLIHPS